MVKHDNNFEPGSESWPELQGNTIAQIFSAHLHLTHLVIINTQWLVSSQLN